MTNKDLSQLVGQKCRVISPTSQTEIFVIAGIRKRDGIIQIELAPKKK